MKKFIFSIICTLLPILASAQEPYVILIDDGTALEFRYDNDKSAYRDAMDIGPFTEPIQRGWDSAVDGIYSVVFTESFANCSTITSTAYWFAGISHLETFIGLENLNTSNVTSMNGMFWQCSALTTLNISSFITQSVTNMANMFAGCSHLTTIRVGSGWSTSNVSNSSEMFEGCTSLVGGNGTTFNSSHIDASFAHVDSENDPGYLTGATSGDEPYWQELQSTISWGTDVMLRARNNSNVDPWMVEELEMFLERADEMYNERTASEQEVRHMIEELTWIIREVEEAMNNTPSGASEEAWAELYAAVEAGDRLLTEARGVSSVEPWALEELEEMTVRGSLMYEEHTAEEEEVRHLTEELWRIIHEVEEMMRQQPQGDASFDGLTAWISGAATLDDAFASVGGRAEAAKTIAAIVWKGDEALTADMLQGIDNPNLLVYVTEASKAPSGVQNLVINGIAEEIILTDASGNNNFFCPQSFTAQSISYTRNFSQTTEIDVCRGWETIALPFDVQSIRHQTHGALTPFGGGNSGYPFWLRQLAGSGMTRATQIQANRPYLICMPNNTVYPSAYNQAGNVTFSATNVTVPVTSAQAASGANVTFTPAFQQVNQSGGVWALNVGEARGSYPEGSVFEQNYRAIRPFQAYTSHYNGARFIPLTSIGAGEDGTTGIQEWRVESGEWRENTWFSLDGRRQDAKPTTKGVYINNGKKVVIK